MQHLTIAPCLCKYVVQWLKNNDKQGAIVDCRELGKIDVLRGKRGFDDASESKAANRDK